MAIHQQVIVKVDKFAFPTDMMVTEMTAFDECPVVLARDTFPHNYKGID